MREAHRINGKVQLLNESPMRRALQAVETSRMKCFKCNEACVPGHSKVCKFKRQIHLITVEDEDEMTEENPEGIFTTTHSSPDHKNEANEELQISMHVVFGTSFEVSTFTLMVKMGKINVVALVDSGSTATFITPLVALKAGCRISNHSPIKVVVANGSTLTRESQCLECPYEIQKEKFTTDFRLLELKDYDIILGSDWIYEQSLVSLNLKTREFSICKDGTRNIKFEDDTYPNGNCVINALKLDKLMDKGMIRAVIYSKTVLTTEGKLKETPIEI